MRRNRKQVCYRPSDQAILSLMALYKDSGLSLSQVIDRAIVQCHQGPHLYSLLPDVPQFGTGNVVTLPGGSKFYNCTHPPYSPAAKASFERQIALNSIKAGYYSKEEQYRLIEKWGFTVEELGFTPVISSSDVV